VILTSLPIIIFPLFDRDVPKEISMRTPKLYTAGITRYHFTHRKMFWWVIEALYAAAICGCIPMIITSIGSEAQDTFGGGGSESLGQMQFAALWIVCVAINARLPLENNSWTFIEWFGPFSMLCMLVVVSCLFNYVPPPPPADYTAFSWPLLNGAMPHVLGSIVFWIELIIIVLLVLAPRLVQFSWVHVFYENERNFEIAVSEKDVAAMRTSHRGSARAAINRMPGLDFTERSLRPQVSFGAPEEEASRATSSEASRRSHRRKSFADPGRMSGSGKERDHTTLRARSTAAFSIDQDTQDRILKWSNRQKNAQEAVRESQQRL